MEAQEKLAIIQRLKINAVSMHLFEAAVRFRTYERKILGIPEKPSNDTDFFRLKPKGRLINVDALHDLDLSTHWSKIL